MTPSAPSPSPSASSIHLQPIISPLSSSSPFSPPENAIAGPSRLPRVVLSPPTSPIDGQEDLSIELPLSPTFPPSRKASKNAKGKNKEPVREVWDVDDPFGRDISLDMDLNGAGDGRAKEGIGPGPLLDSGENAPHRKQLPVRPTITSRQPSRQASMSPSIPRHEPLVLRPERSRVACLDAPVPKDPEHTTGRWLGELCIGAVLCQCCPCMKHDPHY